MPIGRNVLVAALVAAAPVAAFAQAAGPRDFIAKAGASDMYEKQASTLVLQTTRNPGVRSFARQMIHDHTQSTNMVKAAAARDHVVAPSPHLTRDQVHMLAELRGARGPARDAVYLRQQRGAHAQALALMRSYAATGTPPVLRHTAGEIAPVVQHHIDMLHHL